MAGLIRVRAIATSRRRAGLAFTREPLVVGPESLGDGLDALRALASIVGDPVLVVETSGEDDPEAFVEIGHDDRQALIDMATAAELAVDEDEAKAAIADIVERLIGTKELQSPEGADDEGDDAAAPEPEPEAKADGGTIAAPAVETPPASDASAAPGEQSRAGADASGAVPAAGADAGNQPEDTQHPPVAEAKSGDASKDEPAPSTTVAKPARSSGRKPAAPTKAAG
ncbi:MULTISPECIES: hypothetical protein [unclassified Sphingopyxis]|uniref:hypothetical protein n=1 Tax=unclassified Sphingopyxis TaxID=2614943 RepID=UPI00072FE757|nr:MULTISPECIES: hypothetical protein [unclassified Sphingopyxis]KTE24457.1 hypothetical protein ATE61_13705 [Sphingopyxis sp. H057]KTE50985.1 hypothetical protein ATE69_17405 [Sphingopyxis sp. H071]KTE52128.1 hypothetical protein ATE64_12010 [Sphingopyxis sp. H073]KTE60539.1 hypothetical protein ATE66_08135 [Sphingopyxis sp. H107]KTE63872.1 hypothetical protein ATE65_13800 [Sphingopyxis sp. H100]